MAYEQRDNTGSLFKNDRREKDSQPNAKGNALIDGVEYWVSAWTNEARDGSKYQSLKFERKNADQRGSYANQQPATGGGYGTPGRDLEDDVPFVSSDVSLERRVG